MALFMTQFCHQFPAGELPGLPDFFFLKVRMLCEMHGDQNSLLEIN